MCNILIPMLGLYGRPSLDIDNDMLLYLLMMVTLCAVVGNVDDERGEEEKMVMVLRVQEVCYEENTLRSKMIREWEGNVF